MYVQKAWVFQEPSVSDVMFSLSFFFVLPHLFLPLPFLLVPDSLISYSVLAFILRVSAGSGVLLQAY